MGRPGEEELVPAGRHTQEAPWETRVQPLVLPGSLPARRAQPSPDPLLGRSGTRRFTHWAAQALLPPVPPCLPSPGRHREGGTRPGGPRPRELQVPRGPVACEMQLNLRGQA